MIDITDSGVRTVDPSTGHVCPVTASLEVLGSRWGLLIVWHLLEAPRTFGVLRRRVGGISERMLTRELRRLARYGVVERTEQAGRVRFVRYALRAKGEALRPVVEALWGWGREHSGLVTGPASPCRAPLSARQPGVPARPRLLVRTDPRSHPRRHDVRSRRRRAAIGHRRSSAPARAAPAPRLRTRCTAHHAVNARTGENASSTQSIALHGRHGNRTNTPPPVASLNRRSWRSPSATSSAIQPIHESRTIRPVTFMRAAPSFLRSPTTVRRSARPAGRARVPSTIRS